MEKTQYKNTKRASRHNRIRAKVTGTAERPRLAVFRSNRFIYAQLINDVTGKTLAAADSRKVEGKTLTERANAVGTVIAKKAKEAGVEKVVFDRGGYRYQGTVASLADSARAGGLVF
ncbi:MAG: 50S ribosomal protein L18 [Candidatus Nomurabacteria bacterium]|nr:MAG: 50S ribosomal protein L18 [Candidatus Nomurabacteria bacterium]